MPPFILLMLKLLVGLLTGMIMTVALPLYMLLSLVRFIVRFQLHRCLDRFFELYERPCQKFLYDLWWFLVFLGLIIYTSMEEDFDQTK
jgi:hypothetical protein